MKRSILLLLLALSLSPLFHARGEDVYSRPLRTERSRDYDALHYRVKLGFDEEKKTFWGENTITLSPLKDDFSTCRLDAESFTVTSVVGESGNPLDFEQPPHQLIVRFPEARAYGDVLSFTVSYVSENVTVDPEKFGLPRGYALGLSFIEEGPDNPRLIQALSFPTGARHWYPCYDHPNDKATQEVIVTVSGDYKALSNGRLVSVKENEEGRTYHWRLERPHPTYLSVLAAGPYEVLEDSLGDLPINYWVYPRDKEDALRSFYKTPEIIAFFIDEFGYEYPWPKYDQVTVPGIGGGSECTSATLVGQGLIHDERADIDFPTHWIVAHEAAHQWWGDLVTLRDWGHTWINEGFATYYDHLFTLHDLGEEEGAVNLMAKKNTYLREARGRYMRPIVFHRWNWPFENFDGHTYQKAAAVIHMMRWILGDKPFRKTVAHFLHEHAFRSADTRDFLTAVKEAAGRNMDWFFDQWLYKPGHPIFEVSHAWEEDSRTLRLRIEQVQDTSKGVPIFKTPVNIGIVTDEGKSSRKVWLEEKLEEFTFPCDRKPLMVRFDEGNYLLKEWNFEKTLDELLYQLRHDDVIGRMWAAAELAKFDGDDRAGKALMRSAADDPFWAVRREAVDACGGFEGIDHVEFLKKRALDPHSKVRAIALKRLGDLDCPDLVSFLEERFKKDESYRAQAAALEGIGKCGDRSSLELLDEAAGMKSYMGILQRAAIRARDRIMQKVPDREPSEENLNASKTDVRIGATSTCPVACFSPHPSLDRTFNDRCVSGSCA